MMTLDGYTRAEEDAIDAAIRNKAEEEIDTGHLDFVSWLFDYHDMATEPVRTILLGAINWQSDRGEFNRAVETLRDRYMQHRMANAKPSERGDIYRDLFETEGDEL